MKKLWLAFVLSLTFSFSAYAQEAATPSVLSPLETSARQAVIVEASSGEVLFAKDADARMPTSSMSKVLTMYLVFDAIKKGKLSLDSVVTVSETAWKQQGSRTFLNIGQQVKVEDLVRGVIVQSGNDAAVALAEAVAGSEGSFAGLMNDKARELGMTGSHFMNATGLPDPEHYSTARDLATLAVALMRDFPEFYHYYSETEFTFNNIKQGNRNPLLYRNIGVDGMKTGHTEDAGYGLISSARREDRRVVAVVNGLKTMQERADESAKLLDWAYREFALYKLVTAGEKAGEAKVWLGKAKLVPIAPAQTVSLTLPRMLRDTVSIEASVTTETEAPIAKGQPLGKLVLKVPAGHAPMEISLVAMEAVEKLGFFERAVLKIKRMLGKE